MQESSQWSDTGYAVGHFSTFLHRRVQPFPRSRVTSSSDHYWSTNCLICHPPSSRTWQPSGAFAGQERSAMISAWPWRPWLLNITRYSNERIFTAVSGAAPGQACLYSSSLSTDSSHRFEELGTCQGLRQDARRSYSLRQLRGAGQQPGRRWERTSRMSTVVGS